MSPSRYVRPGRFDVVAHRGGGLERPENTLEAFAHAAEIYRDVVFELDVHLTKDLQVVVIHDERVDRTTNGTGFVRDFNLDALQKLDAGWRFSRDGGQAFPFKGKKITIPTLAEVLAKFPQNRVSIEIKVAHPQLARLIVGTVDHFEARERVVIAGAHHADLEAARDLAPELCSGFSSREVFWSLICYRLKLPFLAPKRAQVFQVPFKNKGRTLVTAGFVKHAHAAGKFVHVWTINDEATMRHLLELGVDGIVTDAPSLLVQVAQAFKKF